MGNFIELYHKYASEVTDSPPNFHAFMAIFTIAAFIGKTRYVQYGSNEIYPNFWAIFLAKSSFYRKSTALGIGASFIRWNEPTILYPSEFSHEKLVEVISKYPQGVFFYYEFKTLIDQLKKDYMLSTKAFLTEIFDCPDSYSRTTKGQSVCIQKPVVSLISATTSAWFNGSVREGDLEGGFLGRFIYIQADRKLRNDPFPPKPNKLLQTQLNTEIQLIKGKLTGTCAEMNLSEGAKKLFSEWYIHFCNKIDAVQINIQPLFSRLNIYLLKIAIVVETCDTCELTITEKTMQTSIGIINRLIVNTLSLCENDIAFTQHENDELKVIRYLKRMPTKTATKSQLLINTHLRQKYLDDAISALKEKSQIEEITIKMADKPTKTFRFIGTNGN